MKQIIDILNENWCAVIRSAKHIHRYDPEAASLNVSQHTSTSKPEDVLSQKSPKQPVTGSVASARARRRTFEPPSAPAADTDDNGSVIEKVPMEALCTHLVHSIGLSQRDEPALGAVIASCLIQPCEKKQIVDMKKLRLLCKEQRRPENWQTRFQADGCVDARVQKATTGVVKNCNTHRKIYSGPPFGITGDSDCVNAMQNDYLNGRNKRLLAALRCKAVFGARLSSRTQLQTEK
jgi:hypothetical protein